MKGITIGLTGQYGHFKRPETNNNPCTFSFMHKVAAIGLLGAVIGVDREKMASLVTQLCTDIIYAIRVCTPVVKEAHGFSKRKVPSFERSRRHCEFLREPSYEITLGNTSERSRGIFDRFCERVQKDQSVYRTRFGIECCPCVYELIDTPEISEEKTGEFTTDAVFSGAHEILGNINSLDLIFEQVPVETASWYRYTQMVGAVCPFGAVEVKGSHRLLNDRAPIWFM